MLSVLIVVMYLITCMGLLGLLQMAGASLQTEAAFARLSLYIGIALLVWMVASRLGLQVWLAPGW